LTLDAMSLMSASSPEQTAAAGTKADSAIEGPDPQAGCAASPASSAKNSVANSVAKPRKRKTA
jgi:hypothetical protein